MTLRQFGRGDGAWCVYPGRLGPGSLVYSFGVGRDLSFDLDLIEGIGCEVHAFDPTPAAVAWVRGRRLPPLLHFHPIGLAGRDGTARFALPTSHDVSYTLLDVPRPRASALGQVRRLSTILRGLGHPRVDLLKLDIEGAEYDVIRDIVRWPGMADQLLIEFHHRFEQVGGGRRATDAALDALLGAGFRVFHASPRGWEYSLLRC